VTALPPPVLGESDVAGSDTAGSNTGLSVAGSMIELRDASKVYGDQTALDGVTLDVPEGVIVGLIGPSGCGKTTLVKLLTGIARPTSGDVRVFGTDPVDFDTAQRRRFGYMPQLPVLFPNLTVWGNLCFMASVYGMSLRHRRRRLGELLDLVDLNQHRGKLLSECSGGMQRRLTLAATLVHDPELLFLDEPTAGVDPILRERFWEHFRTLRDQGRTIVVPTQYVGEAVACDLVAVMAAGRLVTVKGPDELARFAYGGVPLQVELSDGWLSGGDIARLRDLPFVHSVQRTDDGFTVVVDDPTADGERLRGELDGTHAVVADIAPLEPSFDDIFVKIIETNTSEQERAET
jgi:ABC-2 type transport system ATP-binding protein